MTDVETRKVCKHCGGITDGDGVDDEFHDNSCPHRCAAAVAAERERCAKVCQNMAEEEMFSDDVAAALGTAADVIRGGASG
jgi:hypothetical protein